MVLHDRMKEMGLADPPAFLQTSIVAVSGQPGGTISRMEQPFRLATMAPRRAPHLAEREELDAALARRSADALQLFIERHPESRYRAEAEEALRKLQPENQNR